MKAFEKVFFYKVLVNREGWFTCLLATAAAADDDDVSTDANIDGDDDDMMI